MLNVEKELQKFAKKVVRSAQSQLIQQGKRNTGKLFNSIDSRLDVSKSGYSFSLDFTLSDFKADSYGDFVDKGVSGKQVKYNTPYTFRSKMPPREPILKWIKRRRIRQRDEQGRFTKTNFNSLAFLIQRSIFNKGIKPSLFFTKAFEKHFKGLDKELQEAYALDLEEFMDFTLNK